MHIYDWDHSSVSSDFKYRIPLIHILSGHRLDCDNEIVVLNLDIGNRRSGHDSFDITGMSSQL